LTLDNHWGSGRKAEEKKEPEKRKVGKRMLAVTRHGKKGRAKLYKKKTHLVEGTKERRGMKGGSYQKKNRDGKKSGGRDERSAR